MEKNLDKKFSLLEIDKEALFIKEMAKSGRLLVEVNEEGHVFEEGDPQNISVVIEYWIGEPESSYFYESQGLNLVSSYKGSKGYWNYFVGPYNDKLELRRDNYSDYLEMLSKRYEIFWTIIPMTIAVFALYMYYNTKNPIFFLLVIGPAFIFLYLRGVKKKIDIKREKIKKGGI